MLCGLTHDYQMERMKAVPTRRLNLKNMFNARDLGGYPTADGKVTKFKVFVRSELPQDLPEEDIQYLKNYGITATVDFRGSFELLEQQSALAEVFPYYHRPVSDSTEPPDLTALFSNTKSMIDMYRDMVEEGKAWAKDVLEMAAAEQGVFLFHCHGGKDRTGVMSCLLLSIAGVSREDIIADYSITEILLPEKEHRDLPPEVMAKFHPEGGPPKPMPGMGDFSGSPASTMRGLLDYLDERYGGVMGYLREIGVAEETIARIREKFLEDE